MATRNILIFISLLQIVSCVYTFLYMFIVSWMFLFLNEFYSSLSKSNLAFNPDHFRRSPSHLRTLAGTCYASYLQYRITITRVIDINLERYWIAKNICNRFQFASITQLFLQIQKRHKGHKALMPTVFILVRLTGIEPVTRSLGNCCSILLSYRRM